MEMKQKCITNSLLCKNKALHFILPSNHDTMLFIHKGDAVSSLKWLIETNELCAMCKEDKN